jgi:hypothetical protein
VQWLKAEIMRITQAKSSGHSISTKAELGGVPRSSPSHVRSTNRRITVQAVTGIKRDPISKITT